MARIIVTREKKKELLTVATRGQGIEIWMFQFIRCDPEFQAELFRTAESVQNWRFLESLSDYRAQQRRASLPTIIRPQTRSVPEIKFRPPKPPQPAQTQKSRPKARIQQVPPRRKLAPQPTIRFTQLKSADFTHCPRCKLRVMKKVLHDHLDLSCPQRGRVDGLVTSLAAEEQKEGVSVVFCRCGAPAMQGDSCCFDHRHT
jgi:hypothetical protein